MKAKLREGRRIGVPGRAQLKLLQPLPQPSEAQNRWSALFLSICAAKVCAVSRKILESRRTHAKSSGTSAAFSPISDNGSRRRLQTIEPAKNRLTSKEADAPDNRHHIGPHARVPTPDLRCQG